MLDALRNPAFRSIWIGYTASSAATAILPTALTLYVLDTRGAITTLGLVLGARTVGFLLGALLGGVLVDRVPRRLALAGSSGLRGLATLAAIPAFDASIWVVCACVLLASVGEGVFRSAYQAVTAEVVDEQHRQAANAATTLSLRACQTAVPLATTLIYPALGGEVTLALAGMLWLGSSAVTLKSRSADGAAGERERERRGNLLQEYRDGLYEASKHRWFAAGLGALAIWLSMSYSLQQLVLPLVSRERFGGNTLIGVALGAYAIGAIAGALVLSRWTPRRPGLLAFAGLSLYGLVPLALLVADQRVIVLAYLLGGLGIEMFNIPWFTAIHREVPREMLGRVSALDFLVSYGTVPLGLAGLPYLITWFGRAPVSTVCGLATGLAALSVLAVPGARELADPRRPCGG
ncbi:MFS transporter [Sorangium sp. So ce375]|uniref:MFS transporter n=1 Tax=Sorangium sp. So ce375 TaxID=3133306 RepID=UPI003F5B6209